jgi:2',3'-cyclic-nucleotide 2'-phosphodiesterase (5'-nucleotidase family)
MAMISLLLLLCGAGGCGFFSHPAGEHRLTVLYFGDLHGHLMPPDSPPPAPGDETDHPVQEPAASAGFARLAGLVHRIRQENREAGIPTLLLVAGDCFPGSPISILFRGEAEFRALNLLQPDAMVLGNHDFDFGLPRLRELIEIAEFPVLAANVTDDLRGKPLARSFTTHYFDGYFAVTIGTTAEDTPTLTSPANVEGLSFRPALAATWETYNTVRFSGDFFIALTHQGLARDRVMGEALGGLNLVVGGHDHLALLEPVFARENCPVVHAGANGLYLGRLDLVFFKHSARDALKITGYENALIPVDRTLPEDRRVSELLEEYGRLARAAYGEPLGTLTEPLVGSRNLVQSGETSLGCLVTDLMREAAGADAALINAGAIRESIPAGPVSLADVVTALPFPNHVVLITLTGSQLTAALRHGLAASAADTRAGHGGAFLHVSGISFRIERLEPAEICVAGEPLDSEAQYLVAVNDFLADGGDGFGPYLGRSPEERYNTFFQIQDLVAEHLRRHTGPVPSPAGGRIRPGSQDSAAASGTQSFTLDRS